MVVSQVVMGAMDQVTMEVDMVVKVAGMEAMTMVSTTMVPHKETREVC